MIFNKHYAPPGAHAFLSASKYHWINYDDAKLLAAHRRAQMAARGTALHAFAHTAITLREKLPDSKRTINMYVNDAIGYRMRSEQLLWYSRHAFGTPDAIGYSEKKKILRVSDLKTGETEAKPDQLSVYCAFFLLEYGAALGITPFDIKMELRIYQNNEVRLYEPDAEDIARIMGTIMWMSDWLDKQEEEMD